MTIVADSGGTKTTWAAVESGNKVVTVGLNPHFTTDEQYLAACRRVEAICPPDDEELTVCFYGAGCGNAKQRQRVESLLSAGFHTAEVHVDTDMLGACRAVSGTKASIVSILGTGSNACYYDGTAIVWQPTSTGYVMGDQGSANHAGRILLDDYLTEKMPPDIRRFFHECFPLSDDELIETVYHSATPNRFLASLAPFAVKNHPYCKNVIQEVLYEWYNGLILNVWKHANNPQGEVNLVGGFAKTLKTNTTNSSTKALDINLVGGFAKALEKEIREFPLNENLHIGHIVADPIEGLLEYHKKAT